MDNKNKKSEENTLNEKEKNIQNPEKEKIEKPKKHKTKKRLYIGYTARLIIYAVLFIITICLSFMIFSRSLKVKDEIIGYRESGNTSYRVYLKPNEYFETPYLENRSVYIASLINNIEVDFNHDFTIEAPSDFHISYEVVGKLSILDNSSNVLFEKEYTLLETKTIDEKNKTSNNIKETVSIDYNYYNTLANNFKEEYGVEATSKLDVYLKINKSITNDSKNIDITNVSSLNVSIPLSQRTINVSIDNSSINNTDSLINKVNIATQKVGPIAGSILILVAAIIILSKFLNLIMKSGGASSKYDKTLNKFLKEYDRLIVETPTEPDMTDKKVIKINRIEELLDARDNLKRPIMYYNVTSHQKSYFYIESGNTYYLYTLKAVDLDEPKKDKKY